MEFDLTTLSRVAYWLEHIVKWTDADHEKLMRKAVAVIDRMRRDHGDGDVVALKLENGCVVLVRSTEHVHFVRPPTEMTLHYSERDQVQMWRPTPAEDYVRSLRAHADMVESHVKEWPESKIVDGALRSAVETAQQSSIVTLGRMVDQQTRALLEVEWINMEVASDDGPYTIQVCPRCRGVNPASEGGGHSACDLDATLTGAGLDTREKRDAARKAIQAEADVARSLTNAYADRRGEPRG